MKPSSLPLDKSLDLAEVAKTLGHPHRLVLLRHVEHGEQPVERLAELCGMAIANASQHLQVLKRAGMVQTRREGKHVFYRLAPGPIVDIVDALQAYVDFRHAEIQALVQDSRDGPEGLEAIALKDLLERMQMDDTLVLDVRPQDEFEQGHLPGALNIPLDVLESRLGELPPGRHIVAYCRGQYCVLSAEAVQALRAGGYDARRFEAGFDGWQKAGLKIEAASS